jgi:sulfur relay protein TusB/DsrH
VKRLCVLITRIPHGDDDLGRVFGGLLKAKNAGLEVSAYLLGDGVLLAKKGPMGENIKKVLEEGVGVVASAKDLRSRAITTVIDGVESVEDFEEVFLNDVMERCDKVISW